MAYVVVQLDLRYDSGGNTDNRTGRWSGASSFQRAFHNTTINRIICRNQATLLFAKLRHLPCRRPIQHFLVISLPFMTVFFAFSLRLREFLCLWLLYFENCCTLCSLAAFFSPKYPAMKLTTMMPTNIAHVETMSASIVWNRCCDHVDTHRWIATRRHCIQLHKYRDVEDEWWMTRSINRFYGMKVIAKEVFCLIRRYEATNL